MQIEAGKYYRARGGAIFGPIMAATGAVEMRDIWPWTVEDHVYFWTADGHTMKDGGITAVDLVEEVAAPTFTAAPDPFEWGKMPEPTEQEMRFQPSLDPLTATAEPEYQSLAGILQHALNQAQRGRGHERHSDDKPFLDQPIMEIARMLGDTSGHTFQIMKKAQEANRMTKREQYDAAVREYLGVINYAAAAILLIREL